MESIATGLVAGWNAVRLAQGQPALAWPRESAVGSLCRYISGASSENYQPANITFDLLPTLPPALQGRYMGRKKERRMRQCELGLAALEEFLDVVQAAA